MDLSLSGKTRALSLICCIPPSSSVSPCRVRSLGGEFLGCGHNLRPPGLRSRRKCRNVGFHRHLPRLFVGASSDLQSGLVVFTVVTVSALIVVYLNYFRRKENPREIPGQLAAAFTQEVRDRMGWIIMSRFLDSVDIQEETSVSENKDSKLELSGIIHYSEDQGAHSHVKEDLMHGETLVSNAFQFPGSDNIAFGVTDSTSSRESKVIGLSSLPHLLSELGVLTSPFATEMCSMDLEEKEQGTELGSRLSMLMEQSVLTTASVPSKIVPTGLNKLGQSNHELIEEAEISGSNSILGESLRKKLFTFYEGSWSTAKSVISLNGLKTLSCHASFRHNIKFPPWVWCSTDLMKVSAQDFLHAAENLEGKLPLGCHKEGSLYKRKDLGNRRGLPRDKGETILHQSDHRNSFRSPHLKEKQGNCGHFPSKKITAYNRLLRDGRLIDCIELLEDMERKGLLDMDNVYHVGFFNACKSQKAVKEAFRFTKLIPNPTVSTYNMLMSVCASSQDSEGAFQVLRLVQEAGLQHDCKLYTTLISTCAKSGKVDAMFKVYHEMVNAEVEPNAHTYSALIDGCAKAGQIAKAFGAYGIMRSKNVEPDRVVFNALLTACGQSGALARAFDVFSEMRAEKQPIDPDHVTVGALMKACVNAGQVDRAREVYNMIHKYNIRGTPELYTIAVNSCSQTGDWEFACNVYDDMTKKGVVPDEMFISAMIDVAGHAGNVDAAFQILQEARAQGIDVGIISYSSLMGACSNAKNWLKALEVYEDIKAMNLKPTVSTMNALITSLCDADQLQKAVEVLSEMKRIGLCPNAITYSILLMSSEKKDDIEIGFMLFSCAKKDCVTLNLVMCRCLVAMCLRRFQSSSTLGEPVLSFNSGRLQIDSNWTSLALTVYRETVLAGVVPTMEEFSRVLGCLQLPYDVSVRNRLIENLGVNTNTAKASNLCSLVDGFGEYDPRAFSLLEEAASLGIIHCISFKDSPIVVDVRAMQIHTAEVYLLTVLKGLKHRLAAGARLPNITILLPIETTRIESPTGEKTIKLAGRISRVIAALLRRLGLPYQGNESHGKIRINGGGVKRWFQPKLASPFGGKPTDLSSSFSRLGKGISHQQRNIRTGNLSLD